MPASDLKLPLTITGLGTGEASSVDDKPLTDIPHPISAK
jgi:hypothetical protein